MANAQDTISAQEAVDTICETIEALTVAVQQLHETMKDIREDVHEMQNRLKPLTALASLAESVGYLASHTK